MKPQGYALGNEIKCEESALQGRHNPVLLRPIRAKVRANREPSPGR